MMFIFIWMALWIVKIGPSKNPDAVQEKFMHLQKCTVWCVLCAGGILLARTIMLLENTGRLCFSMKSAEW